MIEPTLMEYLPLWGLFLATLGIVLAAAEGGYRLGRYRGRKSDAEKEAPVGAIAGATLGLLAFILAFTFGMAASRYDARREMLQEEVNAIGTTYLRAAFLPDDHGPKVRSLLREYVDVRLEALQPNAQIVELIRTSEMLHNRLWAEAVQAGRKQDSEMVSLFVDSLNQVIDLHAKRVTAALRARIPPSIWGALYLVAILSIASMGYHAGLTGTARSITGLGMILSFVVILLLIADLDRPREGMIRVNHQGMIDLRETMKGEVP
jgi:hypothetical protein